MKTKFLIMAIIGTTMFAACGGGEKEEAKIPGLKEAVPVILMEIQTTTSAGVVEGSGQFTTDDETILSFKTGGVISKIFVSEGEQIRKGQTLAALDMTEIQAMVRQAELGVEKAERDFKRVSNLYKDSVATLEQFQNAKTGLDVAKEQLSAAKFNLEYSAIRATSDGVVVRKFAQSGQLTGPGNPVLQISSKGQHDWVLRISVSDREWMKVSLQDSAVIASDVFEGKSISGHVSKKSESVDQFTGLFTVDITLHDTRKLNLASGMFGKAKITTKASVQSVEIPYEALLDANSNQGFVFVTNDKQVAKKVAVTVGAILDQKVVVTGGLESWKYLITAGSAYLKDGSKINVKP